MGCPPFTLWSNDPDYPVGGQPWSGTATKVNPAYTWFQPTVANAPSAQELNYLLNGYSNALEWVLDNTPIPGGPITFTTTDTWVCPAGVTQIDIEIWGAGGAGGGGAGGSNGTTDAALGGGGGAASPRLFFKGIPVVPGRTYNMFPAVAATGGAGGGVGNGPGTNGADGADSFILDSVTSLTVVTAPGGCGGLGAINGAVDVTSQAAVTGPGIGCRGQTRHSPLGLTIATTVSIMPLLPAGAGGYGSSPSYVATPLASVGVASDSLPGGLPGTQGTMSTNPGGGPGGGGGGGRYSGTRGGRGGNGGDGDTSAPTNGGNGGNASPQSGGGGGGGGAGGSSTTDTTTGGAGGNSGSGQINIFPIVFATNPVR